MIADDLIASRKWHEAEQVRIAELHDALTDKRRICFDEWDHWQAGIDVMSEWQCGGGRRVIRHHLDEDQNDNPWQSMAVRYLEDYEA